MVAVEENGAMVCVRVENVACMAQSDNRTLMYVRILDSCPSHRAAQSLGLTGVDLIPPKGLHFYKSDRASSRFKCKEVENCTIDPADLDPPYLLNPLSIKSIFLTGIASHSSACALPFTKPSINNMCGKITYTNSRELLFQLDECDQGRGHPGIQHTRRSFGSVYILNTLAGLLEIRRRDESSADIHFKGAKSNQQIDWCIRSILGLEPIQEKSMHMAVVSMCTGRRVVVSQGSLLEVSMVAVLGSRSIKAHCRTDEDCSCLRLSITDWGPVFLAR